MAIAALNGLAVADLSDTVAGQFAARLFADYGADVTLVEPAGGSVTRCIGPFDGDESLLFFHLNFDKRVVTLDASTAAGREALDDLLAKADVIFTSDDAQAAEIKAREPGKIVVAVTDFAAEGPYAGWTGSEMIHQALGGLMYMTGRAREEPLYGFGHRASYSAGVAAAVAALAAVLSGKQGNVAAVDIHSVSAAMSQNLVTQFSYNGTFPRRGQYAGACDIFRCRDGWVVLFCLPGRWPYLCEALGASELAKDPELATQAGLVKNWVSAAASLAPVLRDRPVDEIVALAQGARVTAARVMEPGEILACPHLEARRFWETVDTPRGPQKILGPIFRMSRTPRQFARPGRTPAVAATSAAKAIAPLKDVRVIELATAWAGPLTGRVMAMLGAEVIKIESNQALDAWRGPMAGGESFRYPDGQLGKHPFNRNAWFNTQNNNKLSLALDLKSPRGQDVIRKLIATSDVVINNYGGGVLERLGLGYEQLQAMNPRIILLQMPATGEGGPLSSFLGVGPTMEALGGFTALTGYGDGVPQRTGPAYVDPIGGLNGAFALLAALKERLSSGLGQRIELAQREALMHWLGEELLYTARTGLSTKPEGNTRADAAPHGAFSARGEDEWIAIAVTSDEQWRAMCDVLGQAELRASRFDTLSGRQAHARELGALIGQVTSARDKSELAASLQARGVAAAPVLSGRDMHDDPQLRALGLTFTLTHPETGTHRYQSLPRALVAESLTITSAPRLGEHTRRILSEVAGLTAGEIDALCSEGVAFQAEALG